jgi:prevent-host-death family protein
MCNGWMTCLKLTFHQQKTHSALMKSFEISYVKNHMALLLKYVERGERFTITKHGKPIAILEPHATKSIISEENSLFAEG